MRSLPNWLREAGARIRAWDGAGFAILVLICLLPWIPRMHAEWAITHDSVIYVGGARTLAEFEGYRYWEWIGRPKIGYFPPLHSLLLAPSFWLRHGLSEALTLIRWTVFVEGLVALCGIYTLLRLLRLPWFAAAGIVASVGTSQAWLRLQEGLMADYLFLALLYWGIVFAFLARDRSRSAFYWVFIGTLFGLLYLTRTAAVAWFPLLIAGVAVPALGRWKRASAFIPPGVMGVAWSLWKSGTTGYSEVLKDCIEQEVGGLAHYPSFLLHNGWVSLSGEHFGGAFAGFFYRPPRVLLDRMPGLSWALEAVRPCLLAVLLAAIAVELLAQLKSFRCAAIDSSVRAVRSEIPAWFDLLLAAGALLYLFMIVTLPSPAFGWSRYFLVVIPLFMAWAWRGFYRTVPIGIPWMPVAGVLLGLNTGYNLALERTVIQQSGFLSDAPRLEIRQVSDWIRNRLPAEARVAGDFRIPSLHLAEALGRPLVIDYLAPVSNWQPASHRDVGYSRADYVVVTREDLPWHLQTGMFTIQYDVPGNRFVVLQVLPTAEEAFRSKRSIPPPAVK